MKMSPAKAELLKLNRWVSSGDPSLRQSFLDEPLSLKRGPRPLTTGVYPPFILRLCVWN